MRRLRGSALGLALLLAALLACPGGSGAFRFKKHRSHGSHRSGGGKDLAAAKRPQQEVWGGPLQLLLVATEESQDAAHEVVKSVLRHRPDANVTVGCLDGGSLAFFERLEGVRGYSIGKKHKAERSHADVVLVLKAMGAILHSGVDLMYLDNTVLWTGDVIEALADHKHDVILPHGERKLQSRPAEDEVVLGGSLVVARASEKTERWVRRWRTMVLREAQPELPAQVALASILRQDEFKTAAADISAELRNTELCPGQGPQQMAEVTITPKDGAHSSARLRGGGAPPGDGDSDGRIKIGVLPYSLYARVCRADIDSKKCDLKATSEVMAVMCPTDEGGAHTAQVAEFFNDGAAGSDVNGPGEERPVPQSADWMEGARKAALAAQKAIEATYGAHAEEVLTSLHFLNDTYVLGKIGRLLVKPRDAPPGERKFVVSFQGTSVTAGHDNLFVESYPLVFERELKSVFQLAGIDLTVRNMGMGNNPPVPSSFCVASQLGLDTDVAVWEFGMMVAGPPTFPMTETWIRNAISLPKRPAIMLVDPGEGPRRVEPAQKEGPRTSKRDSWKGRYNGHGTNLFDYYKDFGVHYQAMFEAVWSTDHKAPYDYYTLMEADKKSEQRAPWHMGPHAHEMRGKILAHGYLKILERALTLAIDAQKADLPVIPEFLEHTPEIPEPKGCNPELCGQPHRCLMTYDPKAEGWDLVDAVTKPDAFAKDKVVESLPNDKWHVQLFETDHEAVKKVLDQKLGYLDMKWVLQGNAQAGPLEFKVETTEEGRLFICQPPGAWGKLPDTVVPIDEGTEVSISGKEMAWEDPEYYVKNLMDQITCKTFKEPVKGGSHAVQVRVKDAVAEEKYVALFAVVYVHD